MKHIFTVDVEDWHNAFPPSIFRAHTSIHRLEIGMHLLLDLLEENNARATFFWFGTYARRYPALLKEVMNRGHEIGCHGYGHFPVCNTSRHWFYDDTHEALDVISNLTGEQVRSFRAPNFSIRRDTYWALDMLASLGIEYDSSIFPMWHWRIGIARYRDDIHTIDTPSGTITEVPIAKRSVLGVDLPVTGGGYFRSYPYALSRLNICHRESTRKPVVFYIHPWELDIEHPRLAGVQLSKLIHYVGLRHEQQKLQRLLSEFSFGSVAEVASKSNPAYSDQAVKDMAHFAIGNI